MLSLDKYLKKSKLHLVICLFLLKNISFSQNLIQNGSFENYTIPSDCVYGGFDNASAPYNHILDNWNAFNTPDYFNSFCNSATWHSVPSNYYGYANAKNGNSYIGIVAYSGNTTEIKEYIYQQFSQPLQGGKTYCLTFNIIRADASRGAIKNIGAYFSNSLPSMVSSAYINVTPQMENQIGFIIDTTQWTQIQGCFTAVGGEQFITIGNFNSNANTDTMTTNSNYSVATNFPGWSYYYIDDITLIDQTTVGVNELGNGSSFEVYPNPTNDILNIDIKNFNKENLNVNIIDVIGKEVLKSDYKNQLDISFLEKGIYFVSIQQNSKTLGVKKIIKE